MKHTSTTAAEIEHAHGQHAHHEHTHEAHAHEGHAHVDSDACCSGAGASSTATAPAGAALFRIATMDCAVEQSEIRRAIDGIPGIQGLTFQLGARTLAITAPPEAVSAAVLAIRQAGFDPELIVVEHDDPSGGARVYAGAEHIRSSLVRYGLALTAALAAESLAFFLPESWPFKAAGMALAALAIGLAGLDIYKKGMSALFHGRLNINGLMSVAVTGAFVIGQWPEAAMVMALYGIAEMIEAKAADRARNAIQALLALAPDRAEVRRDNGTWQSVAAKDVVLNAVVRVRPGERVSLDGIVIAGSSAVDQAPVTGESMPIDKAVGDIVFAGTINQTGALEFRVTAAAANTTLARIIHTVEQAQNTRAPTQRFVDRFAAIYTPTVFVMAIAVAVLMPWLLHWTWLQAIYKALVLLVIACPCALILSTPVTVVSALAAAARHGILIKGGTYLEQARNLKAIALDKTGTITAGKPKLVDWAVLDTSADEPAIRRLAASIACRSDHAVAKAIAAGYAGATDAVENFTALPGRGVQASFAGKSYVLGNHRLIEERGQCSAALEAQLQTHEALGRTITVLATDEGVLALFAVADTIKASSRAAVAELKALGVAPVMLTGDNAATAQTIAAQVGIEEVQANLLPEDKLVAIQALQQRHGATAMTGDGINDSPALAQADIGFAMGGAGTHTAMEAADVVIMNDDLRRIPETIRLSRRTHAVLMQNVSMALGIKGAFFVFAVVGSATMWMAVFADMGASLLVVANGLRLLRADRPAGLILPKEVRRVGANV